MVKPPTFAYALLHSFYPRWPHYDEIGIGLRYWLVPTFVWGLLTLMWIQS